MSKSLQAIRGMNDILPEEAVYWQQVEKACREVAHEYHYQEIRFPIVEQTALFKRSIGEVTDIVEKEMYTFEDRNGDSLTLRPEGTACCVRAGLQHGLFYNQIQRLWYLGPMFRHERPQKGRYRQFYQLGIEAVGMAGPEIEAEVILLSRRLLQRLGILSGLTLQINTLGSPECRARHREALVAYYEAHRDQLDEDSLRRLDKNPLRILDSKNPDLKTLNANAPKLSEYLNEQSQQHFTRLGEILSHAGVSYEINHHLVRGLDYYCHTVFEWVAGELGAQNTVCAGGRYDALIEQLGGKPTPAVGFAMGIERVILLLQAQQNIQQTVDVFFIAMGDAALEKALLVAEQLRDAIPGLCIDTNCVGGSFKSQFKRADKSNARFALIIGEEELQADRLTLKDLRQTGEQSSVSLPELMNMLEEQ